MRRGQLGGAAARDARSLFFFFQAEDGIRDKLVTGVQTCALPIWRRRWIRLRPARTRQRRRGQRRRSEERRVGKGVDLGGRRIIKKKKAKEEVPAFVGMHTEQVYGATEQPLHRTTAVAVRAHPPRR